MLWLFIYRTYIISVCTLVVSYLKCCETQGRGKDKQGEQNWNEYERCGDYTHII